MLIFGQSIPIDSTEVPEGHAYLLTIPDKYSKEEITGFLSQWQSISIARGTTFFVDTTERQLQRYSSDDDRELVAQGVGLIWPAEDDTPTVLGSAHVFAQPRRMSCSIAALDVSREFTDSKLADALNAWNKIAIENKMIFVVSGLDYLPAGVRGKICFQSYVYDLSG